MADPTGSWGEIIASGIVVFGLIALALILGLPTDIFEWFSERNRRARAQRRADKRYAMRLHYSEDDITPPKPKSVHFTRDPSPRPRPRKTR